MSKKLSVKELFNSITTDIINPINEIKKTQVDHFLHMNFNGSGSGVLIPKYKKFNIPNKKEINEVRSTSETEIQIPEIALTQQNTLNVENIEISTDCNFISNEKDSDNLDTEKISDCKITIKLASKNINLFDYMNNY